MGVHGAQAAAFGFTAHGLNLLVGHALVTARSEAGGGEELDDVGAFGFGAPDEGAQGLRIPATFVDLAERSQNPGAGEDALVDPVPDDTSEDDSDIDEIAIGRAITGDTRVRLTHAEQIEVVRRMSERGRSIRTIAELLSTSKRTVSRHRRQGSAA